MKAIIKIARSTGSMVGQLDSMREEINTVKKLKKVGVNKKKVNIKLAGKLAWLIF